METKFYKHGKLNDKKIIEALKDAIKDYEDGAIIECRDTLQDVVDSINEFEDNQE